MLLLALGLTAFAFSALRSAAHQADGVSIAKQEQEAGVAINAALDELAQSQSGVAIWDPAVTQLRKPKPDWGWVDDNIGTWLNFVYAHDVDFILGADDRPLYAMLNGERGAPDQFHRFSAAAAPLIDAARGRTKGPANPHERLPGRPAGPGSTARTSPRAIHATDLVSIGGRAAAMSVMRMIPDTSRVKAAPGAEPLLVSIRYLDTGFARNLAKEQFLAGARVASTARLRPAELSLPLASSRGQRVGYLIWQADRPGRAVWSAMAPSAGLALAGLLGALGALILVLGNLMRRDARSIEELAAAHLELKAKEAQAHHLAYHDPLTGLPNRAFFNSVGDQIAAASQGKDMWAILLIDLDRFKQVNDTLGHLGGDVLIQQVAQRLKGLTTSSDVVARLGGDEFAILLSERDSKTAIGAVAKAMITALRQPFEVLGTDVYIGASIGIAYHPSCSGDRSELMRKADIAMYRAKADGRDAYRFFTEDMDASVKFRREIERDLREAIADKRDLYVHYQPQMDPTGAQVIGFEALLRWDHPERGSLSPQVFVPIAEETGLIRELGLWVMREACDVARAWPKVSMAVNLSPVQFRMRNFASEIAAIVREAGVRPSQIELEVTEGVLLDDDQNVKDALRKLRKAGFRIALDDFGTGYSSLSYLSKFEVDKIKIDRSFTSRLGEADDAAAIIHAVVRLGHAMGLTVSAEGVETPEQQAFLESAGCNELQGFLFSPAVSHSAVGAFMRRHRRAAA
ncbi:MAG: putative bifunctional diguanylate cyclase/phosphodiesterase [Sphingomonas sp.]|uniref:putative bifunctional diguanylate cyclase/phosphodiesterase n=1 Tax=Sphingomonas sp. TaxID=28214 RepID=UPI003F80A9A2